MGRKRMDRRTQYSQKIYAQTDEVEKNSRSHCPHIHRNSRIRRHRNNIRRHNHHCDYCSLNRYNSRRLMVYNTNHRIEPGLLGNLPPQKAPLTVLSYVLS